MLWEKGAVGGKLGFVTVSFRATAPGHTSVYRINVYMIHGKRIMRAHS